MRIIFLATADFAIPSLAALINSRHEIVGVYTQPDREAGRGRKLTATPIKEFALENNLPIFQPESLKSETVFQELEKLNSDIIIDIAYGLFIPEKVLKIAKYGCINVHPSLLPRWRGAAPIQRAIFAGDNETGVTIMQVDTGWDTGDILLQEKVAILANETAGELENRLAKIGADLLLTALDKIEQGTIEPKTQDEHLSCYAAKISKEEAKIDWSLSALQIFNMIRAFNPKPVAYSSLDGELVRIYQALVIAEKSDLAYGTIKNSSKSGIDVITGNGILRVLKLQLPGGKVLTHEEILNSKREMFKAGKRFDV